MEASIDPKRAFDAMWRRMLVDPASINLDNATFDYAMGAVDAGRLWRAVQIQYCLQPTPRNDRFIRAVVRLMQGRAARLSVLPRVASSRRIDFGDGLALQFAEHPAARPFMEQVLPRDGVYEPELVAYLKRTVRMRDIVVDIGAHAGYVSCIAAALGATVIAVEMQPTLIPVIQLNALLNDLWSVHPLCAALGDRTGFVPAFRVEPSPGLRSTVWHWEQAKYPLSSINHDCVPRLTLDSLFPGPEWPSLVKIDVEGAEGRVLAGARELIAAGRTSFLVEVHAHLLGPYGTTLADIVAPFDPQGWSLSTLTVDGPQPLSREGFVDSAGPIAADSRSGPVLFEPRRPRNRST